MQSSPTHAEWVQAIGLNNVLQKKAPATASRKANLIRARLELLPASALAVVATGSQEAAAQMMLAGCIKHSALIADALVRREWNTSWPNVSPANLQSRRGEPPHAPNCSRSSSACW